MVKAGTACYRITELKPGSHFEMIGAGAQERSLGRADTQIRS